MESKEKYVLVEYKGEGYGAKVYTLALLPLKRWMNIKNIAKKYPEDGIPNEYLGGRTSDIYDTYYNIIKESWVYTDEKTLSAFKLLANGNDYIGNDNIFNYIEVPINLDSIKYTNI